MRKKIISIVILLTIAIVIVYGVLLTRSKRALLSIDTSPAAEISIDGKIVGNTPQDIELPSKETLVELSVYGDQNERITYQTKIFLEAGVKTVLKRSLTSDSTWSRGELLTLRRSVPLLSSVTVVTTPPDARVVVDKNIYASPVSIPNLSAGNHILRVSRTDFIPYETVFQATPGFDVTAFIDLEKENSAPKTSSTPPAEVEVEIKDTPTGFLRVRQGPSSLEKEIMQVAPGERYPLIEKHESNLWIKIKVGDQEGWISTNYATIY